MCFLECLVRISTSVTIGMIIIYCSWNEFILISLWFRYIELCRKIQTTYRLEPAGSHGVWGLDDYQFIPFIWGSSQLIGENNKR